MLARSLFATSLLIAPVVAQELRLEKRISSPLLFVAARPAHEFVDGTRPIGLADLLADPAFGLDLVEGPRAGSAEGPRGGSAHEQGLDVAMRLLRRLTSARAPAVAGEVDLVLTGILPRRGAADVPLLVFRAGLSDRGAERMRYLLTRSDFARLHRVVGESRVFRLNGSGEHPGTLIEAVLLGNDLVVSNHGAALEQVLGHPARSAHGGRPALAEEPAYRSLCEQLSLGPGSVLLYADVARLRPRLQALLSRGALGLLHWAGLDRTRAVACAVRSTAAGLRTTMLVDHDGCRDGWLSVVQPSRVADLLPLLPAGIGGVAFGIRPDELLSAESECHSRDRGGLGDLQRRLRDGCAALGLDIESQLLSNLGTGLAVAWVGAEPRPVLAFRPKGREAARRLVADCGRGTAGSTHPERYPPERYPPEPGHGWPGHRSLSTAVSGGWGWGAFPARPQAGGRGWRARPLQLGIADGSVLVGFEPDPELSAIAGAPRGDAARRASASLQRLGAQKLEVDGLVSVDLTRFAQSLAPSAAPSFLWRRHVGYVRSEPSLTRIELLTEL